MRYMGYKQLVVTLKISSGECRDEDYVGIMDAILEESSHWGDFSCEILEENIIDEETG